MIRLLTALTPDAEGMLTHLLHFEVSRSADAIKLLETPELVDQWVVLHFPVGRVGHPKAQAHLKAALYGRTRLLRDRGIDTMVRQLVNGEHVMVARRYA